MNLVKQFRDNAIDKELQNNSRRWTVSSESIDRSFEKVYLSGLDLKDFKQNPVMLYMHRRDEYPIGFWKNIKIEKEDGNKYLRMSDNFDEEDETALRIKRLVEQDFIKAASISFHPLDIDEEDPPEELEKAAQLWTQNGKIRTYLKSKLIETSVVNIGANQDALVQKALQEKTIDEDDLKWLNDSQFDPHKKFFFNSDIIVPEKSIENALSNILQDKAGAVLNKKNKSRLNEIKTLVDEILQDAEKEEPEKKEPEKVEPKKINLRELRKNYLLSK